ncbi:probable LRR receptor-like serine/threonine-protein kinase MEE39 [Quercus lobata]|uniref:probable LRR receptor-like serine/threonine-protein kinase MEE39 n=1 Tax=Quercus lobata TaxID=97700 RepID=UPI001243EB44|nr:probable LRR receptor-like serine/threonine-protein kinase MEE39 [Quercus lobata]
MDDSGNKAYQVPSVVMNSAATKLNVNASVGFFWTPDNGNTVTQYIYLHFLNLKKLQPNQTREFNVFLNGDFWLTQPVVPYYLSTTTAYSTTGTTRAEFKLWLNKTETSTLPPILNAIEIYTLKQLLQAQTDQEDGEVNIVSNEQGRVLESKKQQFTYSEDLSITNNFASVIGKGGFGTVYHGYLDGFQVAVKMLSPSSVQGHKEFQAEAKFLTRIHHKNFTSFVRYCHENTNMGLIYEYMENGNLALHLSGIDHTKNL